MNSFLRLQPPNLRHGLTAVALAVLCTGASAALPPFTFDPSAASPSFAGASITADNIVISDYSHVTINPVTGAFTDTGYLAVQGFQLNSAAITTAAGLNTAYGLYSSSAAPAHRRSAPIRS